MNFAWRLSAESSLLPRLLLLFLFLSLDPELEFELESDGGGSGLPSSRDRDRCPPRIRDLAPAVSRRRGLLLLLLLLLLLPLLLGLLWRSPFPEERLLLCPESDPRRLEFDLDRDLTGLGFLLLDPLLDRECPGRGLLDRLWRTLSLPLGLGVSPRGWSLFPSGVVLSSGGATTSSLLVTVRQMASKASVSGGSLNVTEVVYPFSTAQRNTSRTSRTTRRRCL
jgi:hypothetical protein